MKKALFIPILALSTFCASGQNFGGGFYLGMSTSQISGDRLDGYNIPGANIAAFTTYDFNDKWHVIFELVFIQKGAREPISDTSSFNRVRLNYFEIPLLASYRWHKLSIELGPALDVLLSSKEESQGFEFTSSPPYYAYSLVGIFGVTWHFTDKFSVNFRSNNSLSVIRESNFISGTGPNAIQITTPGQRNHSLSFGLTFNLR